MIGRADYVLVSLRGKASRAAVVDVLSGPGLEDPSNAHWTKAMRRTLVYVVTSSR